MKKNYCLLLILFVLFNNTYAQHKVHLVVAYQPNHTYTQSSDQITNMEIDLGDADKNTQAGSADGKPVKKTVMVHTEAKSLTGKLYKDTLFPLKTVFTKMETSQGASPIQPGAAIYGKASTTGRVEFDSISSEGMNSELKEKLFPVLKSMMSQVVFPNHSFKVGESFIHKTPFSLPLSGMQLDMVINTTYKLTGITGNYANFDIVQEITMSSESVAIPIKATGSGRGSLTYDISNTYYSAYNVDMTINMSSSIEGQNMKIKIQTTSNQNIQIAAN